MISSTAGLHDVAMACGRRLSQYGLLERPEGVFFLSYNELDEFMAGLARNKKAAMELYQRGVIDEEDIGFLLEWGNKEGIEKIIHMIVRRKGFGDILAEASFAEKRLPPKAGDFLLEIKNLPMEMTDERMTKSFALGMATASRGACHMRSRPSLDILQLPSSLLEKLYGGEVSSDFISYRGKSKMIWWHELLYAVCDALGVCRFMTVFSSPHSPQYEEFSQLIYLSSDLKISAEGL